MSAAVELSGWFSRLRIFRSFWTVNIIGWLAIGVLLFARLQLHLDLLPALGMVTFQIGLSLVFTVFMRRGYRVLIQRSAFSIQTAAWLIGVSLAATLVQSSVAIWFISVTGWRNPSWTPHEEWLLRMMYFWLLYMVWSLLYFWIKAEKEARDLGRRAEVAEAERQRMELELLRSQLDPHFLFNALNGVATVTTSDPQLATTMVRELADYLRYSLHNRHDQVVGLRTEIEALEAYLRIEKGRFGDELKVNIDVSGDAAREKLPCFLLQPLVENAVKHSFRAGVPPWELELRAVVKGDVLDILVRNTGRLDERWEDHEGTGLTNLRRRLEIYYPGRHEFSLRQDGMMVCAELQLRGEACSE